MGFRRRLLELGYPEAEGSYSPSGIQRQPVTLLSLPIPLVGFVVVMSHVLSFLAFLFPRWDSERPNNAVPELLPIPLMGFRLGPPPSRQPRAL